MSTAETRARRIQDCLENLVNGTPDISGCALVSDDGLIIGSVLKAETDEESVGGMASVLLSLGSRVGMELGLGELEQVLIRGEKANALMVGAGDGALLLVLMAHKAKLGLVFLDVRRTASELATII
jgi:predicted regulator of Ras-like GTPase activity (Roadblock/LC7/MglB family)